jgi:alpha-amylase
MAEYLAIYCVAHQPRRVKLPAQPIPRGASPEDIERCLFDERMNERYFRKVAQWCYYPATEMWLRLLDRGMSLSLGFSLSLIRQMQRWDPALLQLFQRLVAHPRCELVAVEPYHSFLMFIDLPYFGQRMREACEELERLFGKRPVVADTTEMAMSDPICDTLRRAGFRAGMLDGRPWVLEWRESTHLYHHGDLKLLPRHFELSDDVGYRFSNRQWPGYPLMAPTYAHWLREAWGDLVFLAWDYETFGEHHSRDTGIFEFMEHLPDELQKRGITCLTVGGAVEQFWDRSYELPLGPFASTWAGSGGMEFFLGNSAQQALFQLMLAAYNKAKLTGDPKLLDLALWLIQSDNLHLIQWYGRAGSEAEVSAYFTPQEWWALGPHGIIWEQQCVYRNFIAALEPYV